VCYSNVRAFSYLSYEEERLMGRTMGRFLFFFTTILSIVVASKVEKEKGLSEKKKEHGTV